MSLFQRPALGIYIHLPYCIHHCIYCDFNVYELKQKTQLSRYVEYLLKEIEYFGNLYGKKTIDPLYLGGGTPSVFSPQHFSEILQALQKKFIFSNDLSITVEANPSSAIFSKLRALYELGIRRISFGVQSFQDHHLKTLERIHNAAQATQSYEAAQKAGFQDINLDLIFAIPNQSLLDFKKDVDFMVKLNPTHVSTYHLTVDKSHRFYPFIVEDKLATQMYRLAMEQFKKAGYEHYEVSAFSKPGFQSKHNLKYWEFTEYLGLGAGAYSYMIDDQNPWGVHFSNLRDLKAYETALDQKGHAICETEVLTQQKAQKDHILTGLRLLSGLDLEKYEKKFGNSLVISYRYALEHLQAKGMVDIEGRMLKLKPQGLLYLNQVLLEFM